MEVISIFNKLRISESAKTIENSPKIIYNKENLNKLISSTQTNNYESVLETVIYIRKLTCINIDPPFDDLISNEILEFLLLCLKSDSYNLKIEAAWALTNIASGTTEQTNAVVQVGAVPIFIELLNSSNINICEQAVWALGNIIGEGPYFRDYCINLGVLKLLEKFIFNDISLNFLRNISWVIVNLCRGKEPQLCQIFVEKLLPLLVKLIQHYDISIINDILWALSHLTHENNDFIQIVIDSGIIKNVIDLLYHINESIQAAALRVVGNIATGNDEQTQFLLDNDILSPLSNFLHHKNEKIKKNFAWLISNIVAGNHKQIQSVLDTKLILTIINSYNFENNKIKKEVFCIIENIFLNGNISQVYYLIDINGIEFLCMAFVMLNIDLETIENVLQTINYLIKHFHEKCNEILDRINKCGGIKNIEHLCNKNINISAAYDILNSFFIKF